MKNGIFISYRRKDSHGEAGRIYDRLANKFGKEKVFIDVDSIEPGENFVAKVDAAIEQCDTMLVIIGEKWIDFTKKNAENDKDWIEIEVSSAIKKKLRIIPVLLENTIMPTPEHLPESIESLPTMQAVVIRHSNFFSDFNYLLKFLNKKQDKVSLKITWQFFNKIYFKKIKYILLPLIILLSIGLYNSYKNKQREASRLIEQMCKRDNFVFIPSIKEISFQSKRIIYEEVTDSYNTYLKLPYATKLNFWNINSFLVSRRNITSDEWEAVTGEKAPKRLKRCSECPLDSVPWEKVRDFLEKLELKTGHSFRILTKAEKMYLDSMNFWNDLKAKYHFADSKIKNFDLGFRLCSDTKLEQSMYLYSIYGDNYDHFREPSAYVFDTLKLKRDTIRSNVIRWEM